MIELFECKPLSARISKVQCEKNRSRKEDVSHGIWGVKACEGCPGLGNKLESVEVKEMAKICSVWNCTKLAQGGKDGMCKAHFSGKTPRPVRRDAVADAVKPPVVRKDPVTTPAEKSALVSPVVVPVSSHETHIVNLVTLFKAKQEAELNEFISGLDGCVDDRSRLEYTLQAVA